MLADFNLVVLYVDNPVVSAQFYAKLLEKQPVESSPFFVLFELTSGIRLGLWSRKTVEPSATASGGGGELAVKVEDKKRVDELFLQCQQQGLNLIQDPTMMGFGYTFTALDPDDHRLRVYSLNDNE